MPRHWSKERVPDELRDYLETVFDAYDRIVFDWPTEYRQISEQGVAEEAKHGLYYNVNKRKKAGTSRDASSPKAPTAQAWKNAAKTAKKESVAEAWSQKYKSSINCSHPKGFSQKAHCAGKKKHNEDITMEMTCPDCGMCESHGSLNEIKKGAKDSNGVTKCWSGYHAAGTKKSATTGKQVRNCVPNESMLPSSAFTGSKKNKINGKGMMKATADHARPGDLVGGG
jgi:hypothetical protein